MEQGSYKTLFVKLSGVAFGLVAMLAVAVMLTRSFTLNSPDQMSYEKFTGSDSVAKGEMNDTLVMLRDMQSEHLARLIDSKSHIILILTDAIETVTGQAAIPGALRENILTDLGRQLAVNQKELGELENYLTLLSPEIIPSKSSARKKSIEALTWI